MILNTLAVSLKIVKKAVLYLGFENLKTPKLHLFFNITR